MVRGVLERLHLKARHGLILQEIMNTLGRRGLWVSPYIVYCESGVPGEDDNGELTGLVFREIRLADTPTVAVMDGNRIPEAEIRDRLSRGSVAFGAFRGDSLVAIMWANLKWFQGLGDSPPVRDLARDEAYMYGAFTVQEHRGRGIIPAMRTPFRRHLWAAGIRKCYSVNMYFNRSARRLKQKFLARELELRLSIILFGHFRKDILLKTLSG